MEKSKTIEKLFEHINTYAYLLLPVLFLITRSKKRDAKILAVYGIVLWLLLFFYYDIPKSLMSTVYQPLYTTLEYLFFTSFFFFNLETKKFKLLIKVFSILFILFQFSYILFLEKRRLDSIPIGVESILIFVYIIFFFSENFSSTNGEYIYTNHCFWISIGLLFYLGGSFFLNILGNTLTNEEFLKYWYFNYIADTIKTIFFIISYILLIRKKKSNDKNNLNSIPFLDIDVI